MFSRIIKEGANVPLFLGQTMISALRDLAYNHTTSAICEHIDNSFQWGGKNVRLYFHEKGKKGARKIDVLIVDDGVGMSPNVLSAVTAFGGSLCTALIVTVLPTEDFQILLEIAVGHSYADMAQARNMTPSSMKSRAFRVREKVRDRPIAPVLRNGGRRAASISGEVAAHGRA